MPRRSYRLLQDDDRTYAKYLQARYKKDPAGRTPLGGGERKALHDKRKEIRSVISDLTWFAKEWPESELSQVFTADDIKELVIALTPAGGKQTPAGLQRQYEIAALFMERGINKCLESVDKRYRNYIERDAWRVLELLKVVAVGREGIAVSL